MKKAVFIFGTRPEIIKLHPLIEVFKKNHRDFFIIHTGQHYDPEMNSNLLSEFGLDVKYQIAVRANDPVGHREETIREIEKILQKELPDLVVVHGDTNSTLAGALAGFRNNIRICHIEAGLRSYDLSMPEEIIRIIVDHLADYLFCPTKGQRDNLLKEGIGKGKIFVSGNTIVDSVNQFRKKAKDKPVILGSLGLVEQGFILLTCHRPSNTDNNINLMEIMEAVNSIAEEEKLKIIFPLHPRLRRYRGLIVAKFPRIQITSPVNFTDLLVLQLFAHFIFTDSGGIQEESCILEKKCLILRTNTERPETLKYGAMLLDKITKTEIRDKYVLLKTKKVNYRNPYGRTGVSEKIFNSLVKI